MKCIVFTSITILLLMHIANIVNFIGEHLDILSIIFAVIFIILLCIGIHDNKEYNSIRELLDVYGIAVSMRTEYLCGERNMFSKEDVNDSISAYNYMMNSMITLKGKHKSLYPFIDLWTELKEID